MLIKLALTKLARRAVWARGWAWLWSVALLCSPLYATEKVTDKTAERAIELVFTTSSYNYSEVNSIDSAIHEFNGPLTPGDHGFSYNQASADLHWRQWTFGISKRLEHYYRFSFDTAKLYRIIENKIAFTQPTEYQLDLYGESFDLNTVNIGYQFDWFGIKVKPVLHYIHGNEFSEKELQGKAFWHSEDSYDVFAPGRVYSSKNILLTYPKINSRGQGYSVDLHIDWRLSQHWRIQLSGQDLASKITWPTALESNINSWKPVPLTEQGRLDTRPTVYGKKLDYSQQLFTKTFASLTYIADNQWQLALNRFQHKYARHHSVIVEAPWQNDYAVNAGWHIDTQAVQLGLRANWGQINLLFDDVRANKAQTFAISASFAHRY